MTTTRHEGAQGETRGSGPSSRLPAGGQVRRLALTGTKGLVGQCREFTRGALRDWGWLPGGTDEQQAVAEDALLLVSELVTNACVHAGGPTELSLRCTEEVLRVQVRDRSPEVPTPQTPHRASQPGGHGLHIIARLTADWGTTVEAGGKTVWLEIRSPLIGRG